MVLRRPVSSGLLACTVALLPACAGGCERSLSGWIESLVIPVGDVEVVSSDQGETEISDMTLHSIQLPSIFVKRTGPESLRLGFNDVRMSANVGRVTNTDPNSFLRWLIGMETVELADVSASLTGSFTAEVTVPLTQPYLIKVSQCKSQATVTSFENVKTKVGWVYNADPTGQLGRAIDGQIKDEIVDQFNQQVCGVDGIGRDLQERLDSYLHEAQTAAKWNENYHARLENQSIAEHEVFHWQESPIFQWLRRFIADAERNGLSADSLFEPLFRDTNAGGLNRDDSWCLFGTAPEVTCPLSTPSALNAKYQWTMSDGKSIDMSIEHLTVLVSDLDVQTFEVPAVSVRDPDWLGVNISVGPANTTMIVDFRIDSDAYQSNGCIAKSLQIDLDIRNFSLESFILYEVPQDKYLEFTPVQRYTPACLDSIATVFHLVYLDLDLLINDLNLTISPAENITQTEQEQRLVESLEELIDALVVTGVNSNPGKIEELFETFLAPKLELYVNNGGGLDGMLSSIGFGDGSGTCPASTRSVVQAVMQWFAFGLFAFAGCCFTLVKCKGAEISTKGVCLAMKPTTGLHWAITLPLLVVVSALLFVISNVVKGASVNVYLKQESGIFLFLGALQEFSVFDSIGDLWESGMIALASMLFIFSVILPYAKLLLSLFIFLGPISTRAHGRIVKVMDTIGKWSLLDAYALIAIIGLTSLKVTLSNGQGVALAVEAQVGFIAFLLATILLLVIGNVLLMLHRRAHRAESHEPILRAHSRLSLCATRQAALNTFLALFVVGAILICAGAASALCSVELEGLVGWSLDFLQKFDEEMGVIGKKLRANGSPGNVLMLSLLNLGWRIRQVTVGTPWIQTLFIQFCYFAFVLVVPVSFLVAEVVMCMRAVVGRHASDKLQLWTLAHSLFSWSALDVYVVGLLVTVAELGHSSPLTGSQKIDRWIDTYLGSIIDMPGKNCLVEMKATFHAGAWLLAVGAAVHFFTGIVFLRSLGWLQGSQTPTSRVNISESGSESSEGSSSESSKD